MYSPAENIRSACIRLGIAGTACTVNFVHCHQAEKWRAMSPLVGVVYVFNLIVGTGALTLPKAMASAGWLVSVVLLILLCLMSYITTTFMVESLSIANACLRHQKKENSSEDCEPTSDSDGGSTPREAIKPVFPSERSPLLHSSSVESISRSSVNSSSSNKFSITQAVEMGQMADMFFNKKQLVLRPDYELPVLLALCIPTTCTATKLGNCLEVFFHNSLVPCLYVLYQVGRILFYLCIIIYLYGDLAIYAAAVPKSLRDIVCGNLTCGSSNHSAKPSDNDICWHPNVTRIDVYRVFLAVFAVCVGPFAYFDVQKTKYLQIATSLLRWFAFGLMILLAIIHISKSKSNMAQPPIADISGVPNLFGVSVYSFMCQHSLPSLVTPIKNKRGLSKLLAADYVLILVFYMLLGMTAIFCFQSDVLKDIYTLNFQDSCEATSVTFFRYFLGLFPVFTLSTNFPIISVTLRNNLKALLPTFSNPLLNRLVFPTLAILPPIAVAFGTNNLTTLVGVTGSYAGAGVQYIIPAFLVLIARREASLRYSRAAVHRNKLKSPFGRRLWVIAVLSWAVLCLIFVTTNHILTWV